MEAIRRLSEFFGVPVTVFYQEAPIDSSLGEAEARQVQMLLIEAEIALADRDFEKAEGSLAAASTNASRFVRSGLHGRLEWLQGRMHRLHLGYEEAIKHLLEALTIHRNAAQRIDTARVLLELAVVNHEQDRFHEAQYHYELVLKETESLDHTNADSQVASLRLQAFLGLGVISRRLGRFNQSLDRLSEALRLSERLVDSRRLAHACAALSGVREDVDTWAVSLIYRAREDLKATADVQHQTAVTLLWLGRTEEARGLLEQSKATHQALNDDRGLACNCLGFSQLFLKNGDLPQAKAWAERAHGIFVTLEVPRQIGEASLVLALVADMAGDREEARRRLREVIGIFKAHGLTTDLARAFRKYAECAERWGAHEEANRLYRQSLELLEQTRSEEWDLIRNGEHPLVGTSG